MANPSLSREEMLRVMTARDAAYDGQFLVGVRTTGVYCLPSCRGRLPKPENVEFFADAESARRTGLRPCKRCRPEDLERSEEL